MSKNQKGLAPIIIILIAVAVLAGGILAWQYFEVPREEVPKEEVKEPEVKIIRKITTIEEFNQEAEKCEKIQDVHERERCWVDLIEKIENEKLCEYLPEREYKASCYQRVAIFKKDKAICEKIEVVGMRASCFAKIAELTKKYSEENAEKIIKERANEVILVIKNKDIEKLSSFVHPDKGVRFSPYTYVDPEKDLIFSRDKILEFFKDQKVYTWGIYDGIGTPIDLTPEQYYNRFIYDADFANAKEISYNRIIGRGNTINNTFLIYPEAIIVEYHFSGFDPKFEGMDWVSLRLVFEEKDNIWYLVGIVHDEWTI